MRRDTWLKKKSFEVRYQNLWGRIGVMALKEVLCPIKCSRERGECGDYDMVEV